MSRALHSASNLGVRLSLVVKIIGISDFFCSSFSLEQRRSTCESLRENQLDISNKYVDLENYLQSKDCNIPGEEKQKLIKIKDEMGQILQRFKI